MNKLTKRQKQDALELLNSREATSFISHLLGTLEFHAKEEVAGRQKPRSLAWHLATYVMDRDSVIRKCPRRPTPDQL